MIGECLDCKYNVQAENCCLCGHPKAIIYYDIKIACPKCGRKPSALRASKDMKGCARCLGNGNYIYAGWECDINKFEKRCYGQHSKKDTEFLKKIGWKHFKTEDGIKYYKK